MFVLRRATARGLFQRQQALSLTRLLSSEQHIDDSLSSVLREIKLKIENASTQSKDADFNKKQDIPGVKSAGQKLVLKFTCTNEPSNVPPGDERRTHLKVISSKSYETGNKTDCRCSLL